MPPVSGWGISYASEHVIVEIYITETTKWSKPTEITQLLISDLAVSSGVREVHLRPHAVSEFEA